ncbi:MAG TPA: SRPBCC family protein [Thermoanaerobaculia bacterium]|nr:SRPBCC family protein [Thermoanaerobaculia bacterium]
MESLVSQETEVPVRKSITVKASAERAFRVFTAEFDSWWPRSHHIGNAPMKKAVIEGVVGGRCYSEQIDGTDCPWGTILEWEPPRRFVMAWQITPQWQYEPDISKSSEVEVRFTPQTDGSTRIDLEHRYFHRHGAGATAMRAAVDSPNGWGDLLKMFVAKAEERG